MVQVNEQVAAMSKAQLEAAVKMAQFASENVEKLTDVQMQTAKAAYADSINALKQLAGAKDVNELISLSGGMTQPSWEKATGYVKSLYEILATTQTEFASMLEAQVAEFNKNMVVTMDAAMKSAPPGSESALAAAKSAIHSANMMYETMAKAVKQMATLAEANVAAVAQAAPKKKTA